MYTRTHTHCDAHIANRRSKFRISLASPGGGRPSRARAARVVVAVVTLVSPPDEASLNIAVNNIRAVSLANFGQKLSAADASVPAVASLFEFHQAPGVRIVYAPPEY